MRPWPWRKWSRRFRSASMTFFHQQKMIRRTPMPDISKRYLLKRYAALRGMISRNQWVMLFVKSNFPETKTKGFLPGNYSRRG